MTLHGISSRMRLLIGTIAIVLCYIGLAHNAQAATMQSLATTSATVGPNDVGVIPSHAGGCPQGSTYFSFYMDDEDTNNTSSMSGWTGAFSESVGSHVNGTRIGYCSVDGSNFRRLSSNVPYGVFRLGSSCPNGSDSVEYWIDNERTNNQNSITIVPSSTALAGGTQSGSMTYLYVCVFGASTPGTSMASFPDVGMTYGVLATPGTQSYWLQGGTVFTDDDDGTLLYPNRNRLVLPPSPHVTTSEALSVISTGSSSGSKNTYFHLARVRDLSCPAVQWWTGGTLAATSDGAASCFVANVPSGETPFIWDTVNFYITSRPGNTCPLGTFVVLGGITKACYIAAKPTGGYIQNSAFFAPATGVNHNTCPSGWTYAGGGNCWYADAPTSTTAFEQNGNFYTTTLPSCPNIGNFDGANCWLGRAPAGRHAFISNGKYYYG